MKNRRYGRIGVLAIVILANLIAFPRHDLSLASEMGFKFNRRICPQTNGFNGRNWISLPFANNYVTAQDLCVVLGLGPGPGRVLQWNADTGVVRVHSCGNAGAFPLFPFVGVEVGNVPFATNGVVEGAHIAPPAGIPLYPVDGPPMNGKNLWPVPYHSMAGTMQGVCVEIGLPAGPGRIIRLDACTGITTTWNCGAGNSPPIFLGEAVVIDSLPAGIVFMPAHF